MKMFKLLGEKQTNNENNKYKVFTNQFDKILEANELITDEEISKLRGNLDVQLSFTIIYFKTC